jgi:pimeloyl-ACP methyl ester carboxylesterase
MTWPLSRRVTRCALALAGSLALAACGASSTPVASTSPGGSPTQVTSSSPNGAALPRIVLPVKKGETVEGLVNVGGHDIYARCDGTGSPTVVYFTGWAPDGTKRGVDAIGPLESVDHGRHRICSYERRNTGRSEKVKGTQSPEDVVGDVDGVLHAVGERGPFVLLGASFGGLVASAYAVAHPGRVAGVLLLDASIPDDVVIDRRHGFTGVCNRANRHADAWDSWEKLDNCRLARWAYDRRDRDPDVPLTYLAAADPSDRGDVADDPLRKAFVHRWSPGVWEKVDAPHWMDEAAPRLVERELNRIVREAAAG